MWKPLTSLPEFTGVTHGRRSSFPFLNPSFSGAKLPNKFNDIFFLLLDWPRNDYVIVKLNGWTGLHWSECKRAFMCTDVHWARESTTSWCFINIHLRNWTKRYGMLRTRCRETVCFSNGSLHVHRYNHYEEAMQVNSVSKHSDDVLKDIVHSSCSWPTSFDDNEVLIENINKRKLISLYDSNCNR